MAKVLAALWLLSIALNGTAALVRSDYLAMGMAGTAMVTSASSALYVYWNVARTDRSRRRVHNIERGAAEIERRLGGK